MPSAFNTEALVPSPPGAPGKSARVESELPAGDYSRVEFHSSLFKNSIHLLAYSKRIILELFDRGSLKHRSGTVRDSLEKRRNRVFQCVG